MNSYTSEKALIKILLLIICSLLSASIMTGGSGMHGGGSGGVSASAAGLNGVKLEGPGYYCNSYTPPAPVDHGLLSSAYSKWRDFFRGANGGSCN